MTPRHSIITALIAALALTLTACEQEGPAERAGKAIDSSAEQAGDKIEQAGDKLKEAVEDAKKQLRR